MQNATEENKDGVGSDNTTADDQAGGDTGAEDTKKGDGGTKGDDDTVTIKKSDLKKIEEDRDNYRDGLLKKKADERDLKAGDDKGTPDNKGADNVIDEDKISKIASAATNKSLREASERTAKRAFLKAHPEYVDDAQWTTLMSNLTFRGNELTHEDVVDRMEAALIEHKRSTGKLEEHFKSERERGVREGRIQAEAGSGRGAGGVGDRNDGGGKGTGGLSPKGEEMARAMHVDPEKAKKVDPSKDNVINEA